MGCGKDIANGMVNKERGSLREGEDKTSSEMESQSKISLFDKK